MDKDSYYLLKFINTAKNIKGRKKLQKLMYILKHLGCPIEARFFMHFYGPYSSDLALQIDNLVEKKFLDEDLTPAGFGLEEYIHKLTGEGKKWLVSLEKITIDDKTKKSSSLWAKIFKDFNAKFKVNELEVTSTLLYWLDWGKNLDEAIKVTARQKKINTSSVSFQKALDLTKTAVNLKQES